MAENITKYLQQFIDENVNRRYSYVEYNSRDKNLVIDSSCPLRICQDMNSSSSSNTSSYHSVFSQNGYSSDKRNSFYSGFPKDSYAISEAFANRFMVKRIPLEILINALGFTKKDISELLASVKARRPLMPIFPASCRWPGRNRDLCSARLCRENSRKSLPCGAPEVL